MHRNVLSLMRFVAAAAASHDAVEVMFKFKLTAFTRLNMEMRLFTIHPDLRN